MADEKPSQETPVNRWEAFSREQAELARRSRDSQAGLVGTLQDRSDTLELRRAAAQKDLEDYQRVGQLLREPNALNARSGSAAYRELKPLLDDMRGRGLEVSTNMFSEQNILPGHSFEPNKEAMERLSKDIASYGNDIKNLSPRLATEKGLLAKEDSNYGVRNAEHDKSALAKNMAREPGGQVAPEITPSVSAPTAVAGNTPPAEVAANVAPPSVVANIAPPTAVAANVPPPTAIAANAPPAQVAASVAPPAAVASNQPPAEMANVKPQHYADLAALQAAVEKGRGGYIRVGSKDKADGPDHVAAMQRVLKEWAKSPDAVGKDGKPLFPGYEAKKPGEFTAQDRKVLKEMQKTYGADGDGVAGVETLRHAQRFIREDGSDIKQAGAGNDQIPSLDRVARAKPFDISGNSRAASQVREFLGVPAGAAKEEAQKALSKFQQDKNINSQQAGSVDHSTMAALLEDREKRMNEHRGGLVKEAAAEQQRNREFNGTQSFRDGAGAAKLGDAPKAGSNFANIGKFGSDAQPGEAPSAFAAKPATAEPAKTAEQSSPPAADKPAAAAPASVAPAPAEASASPSRQPAATEQKPMGAEQKPVAKDEPIKPGIRPPANAAGNGTGFGTKDLFGAIKGAVNGVFGGGWPSDKGQVPVEPGSPAKETPPKPTPPQKRSELNGQQADQASLGELIPSVPHKVAERSVGRSTA